MMKGGLVTAFFKVYPKISVKTQNQRIFNGDEIF